MEATGATVKATNTTMGQMFTTQAGQALKHMFMFNKSMGSAVLQTNQDETADLVACGGKESTGRRSSSQRTDVW